MPIRVQCPQCGRMADVSRAAIGRSARCSECKQIFPVPVGSGDLLVEWGVPMAGRRLPLSPPQEVTIGRAEDNTLVLPGATVSRHHARVVWEDDSWMIRDLGSGNGTIVDGERIREAQLGHNSGILIGDYALRATLPAGGMSSEEGALDALATRESAQPDTAVAVDRPARPGAAGRVADPKERTVVALPTGAPPPPGKPRAPSSRPTAGPREAPAERSTTWVRILIWILAVILGGIVLFLTVRG